jgi:hypothetical protein
MTLTSLPTTVYLDTELDVLSRLQQLREWHAQWHLNTSS